MALTEAEEKNLKDGLAQALAGLAAIQPLAAKVPELENTLKAKDAEITALKTGHANLSQQAEKNGLKTTYPDVPEVLVDHALTLPADKRDALLKPTQEKLSKVKVTQTETDPMKAWADAGSIGPTTEAEAQAKRAEDTKKYSQAKDSGNLFGMLSLRGTELAAHVRQALAKK